MFHVEHILKTPYISVLFLIRRYLIAHYETEIQTNVSKIKQSLYVQISLLKAPRFSVQRST